MLLLQSSFYAIAVGFCLLCIICVKQCSNRIPVRFFLIYLVLEAVGFGSEWLMVHPSTPMKSLWLTVIMSLSFFIAPCLWLYAREVTERTSPSHSGLSSWHACTVIVGLIMLLPLAFSSHTGSGFIDPASPTTPNQDFLIHTTMLIAAAIFLVQSLFYLKLCKDILVQRTRENLALFSTIDDSSLNTLRILIVAVIANWLVSALRIVNCVTPGDDNSWTVFFAGSQTLIIAYVIFAVFKQEAGFKQHVQVAREALQESTIGDESGEKYANSSLSAARRERIQQKLDHAMRIEKRYTDNEISLSVLCDFMQESPHQVSQVINESDYQNFYDLINQHRVDAAKEQLLSRSEQSVLEVAFAVGFNSKSTFNSAFKRYVNVTPTQYRQNLIAHLVTE